jgi:hypothetical protein
MKKFLIISYNYQPYNNPRAIRWGSILNFVKKKKITIDFVTLGENKKNFSKNITFHHHENLFLNKPNDQILNKSNTKKLFFHNIKDLLYNIIIFFYKFIGRYFVWPDYAFYTIYPFYKTSVKLIETKKIKNVITVSHPFSSHIVGLLLKIRFPNLIWDVDNGDPFYLMKKPKPNNLFFYNHLNYLIEKNILERCRKFYVNNIETKKKYLHYFKTFKHKIDIIEPLCLIQKNKISKSKNLKYLFKLFYAGSFYSDIRNPKSFLQIINSFIKLYPNRKKDMRIYIFTNSLIFKNELQKYSNLKSIFILRRQIDHLKLMRFIKSDMISLNFGNNNNLQTPSKLYELIGLNLKIINFNYKVDKMSIKILKNYPNHLSINLQKTNSLGIINNFLIKKKFKVSKIFFDRNFKKNSIRYISNQYFGL